MWPIPAAAIHVHPHSRLNPRASEESLIARILETPAGARAETLRRLCAENPELKDRLQQIVQAVCSMDGDVREIALPSSDAERARVIELAFSHQEKEGVRVGPYTLIRKLGEGGFGVVWLAEQQEPIRRQVAVKVIKSGMDSREVIARFETERQALALMDHPGIARVFDAGTTDGGRPYFVMELVKGIPITRYCDDNRLGIPARLRLFISVCRAVQHAHQKGVIHRDLKPSNIIVTVHDGVASPKIIDFGIAKATESAQVGNTLFTRFHAFIGTPAYTSPEQMEMSGLDVDTRSDIYSLGVLLYEMLTGGPPFNPVQLLRSSLEDMRRTIREVEPPTPSQSVKSLEGPALGSVASKRAANPAGLIDALHGDLDSIAMHCLEKDRTRRYDTASALASDVCHYLDDEPVVARPASVAYRLQKFTRRNRVAVTAGAAVIVSLVTGLVVAAVGLAREHEALERESTLRVQADEAANQARIEAAKSDQVARFMKDMLRSAGPSAARGRDVTMMREIVEATARRLDSELGDQPEVLGDMRETLAMVQRDLGRSREAEELMREVVAFTRARFGDGTPKLADALVRHGELLGKLNRIYEAESVLKEALAIQRAQFGERDPIVADTLFELAKLHTLARTPEETNRMLQEILSIRREAFGPRHVLVAETLEELGTSAVVDSRPDDAVERYLEALAMYRSLLGNEHPSVGRALFSLASALRDKGPAEQATERFREAFLIQSKVLAPDHPDLTVTLLDCFADAPIRLVDESTIEMVREFVGRQRESEGGYRVNRAPALILLATMLDTAERDPGTAMRLYHEAEALIEGSLAGDSRIDLTVANAMFRLAWCKLQTGDPSEGIKMCEMGVRALHDGREESRGTLTFGLMALGWVYLGIGMEADAVTPFSESLSIMRARWAPDHGLLGLAVAGKGRACRMSGDIASAREVLEGTLSAWKWGRDPEIRTPRWLSAVLCEFGYTLNQESRYREAEEVFRDSIRLHRGKTRIWSSENLYPLALAERGLGTALVGQGRLDEAEPLLTRAFEGLKTEFPGEARMGAMLVAEAREALAALNAARGESEAAERWLAGSR